jgi:hypothetical protein
MTWHGPPSASLSQSKWERHAEVVDEMSALNEEEVSRVIRAEALATLLLIVEAVS